MAAAVIMHDDQDDEQRFPTMPRKIGRPREGEKKITHVKSFTLDDDHVQYLRQVAEITGASEADIVRAALEEYRQRYPISKGSYPS